jgi:hypothetical protein
MHEKNEQAVDRRRLLRRAGTVAAGVGAAGIATAVAASPANAATGGNVILGQANTSDADTTSITSTNAQSTLTLANTAASAAPLVLTPAAFSPTDTTPDGSIGFDDQNFLQYTWSFIDPSDPSNNVLGITAQVYDESWSAMPVALTTPQRVLDTRPGSTQDISNVLNPSVFDSTGRLKSGSTLQLDLSNVGFFALGVFGTLAAIQPAAGGFLKLFPLGTPEPATANIGYAVNQNVSNSFFIGAGFSQDGSVTTGLSIKAQGATHVILDVFGLSVSNAFDVLANGAKAATKAGIKSGGVSRAQLRAKTKHPLS